MPAALYCLFFFLCLINISKTYPESKMWNRNYIMHEFCKQWMFYIYVCVVSFLRNVCNANEQNFNRKNMEIKVCFPWNQWKDLFKNKIKANAALIKCSMNVHVPHYSAVSIKLLQQVKSTFFLWILLKSELKTCKCTRWKVQKLIHFNV